MISITAPAAVNQDTLTKELRSSGLPCRGVALKSGVLYLSGLTEDHQPEAEAVVAMHAGLPSAEQQAELDAIEDERQMAGRARQVVAKARRVLDGTDTFTNAQIQQIVAALVIYLARQRRDS